jgi:hypothetical protein
VRGIHVKVQQQGQLFQGGMPQQLRLVADENRMLLFALVEMHFRARKLDAYLTHQLKAAGVTQPLLDETARQAL